MDIDKAIKRYNKLASRRDGRINVPALNEIAEKLAAQVPPGQRPDVDLLLGRPAELPERVEYQTQPNSTQAEIDRQQRIYEQLSSVKEVWSTSEQRTEYSPKKSTVFDPKWSDRAIYLTTTVDNGYEPDALIEYATPDNIDKARQWAAHNLDWFGKQHGFKTTCRISIDNLFEEITIFDPAGLRPSTDTAAATEAVAELAQEKQDEYLIYIADQHEDRLDFLRLCGDLAI